MKKYLKTFVNSIKWVNNSPTQLLKTMKYYVLLAIFLLAYKLNFAQSKSIDTVPVRILSGDIYHNYPTYGLLNKTKDTISNKNILLVIDDKIQYFKQSLIDEFNTKTFYSIQKIECFNNETGINIIYLIKTKK